jgi:LacI family transcriptional regulator
MEAAEELGYRPNNLVQAIRSGKTRIVGVMVPPYDSYWSDVLHGIHDKLIEGNYVPLALWSKHRTPNNDPDFELEQIQRLIDWRVDGAILWPWFANLYHTHISELKTRETPLVTIDTTLPESFFADAVLSDETLGAELVAAHLQELGHQEILHFAGPCSQSWALERRRSFEEALRGRPGIKLHVMELPLISGREDFIRDAMTQLCKVTAVFCATDAIAEEVYKVATDMGLSIPGALSVIGFGNVDFGSRLIPQLSTVRHQPYRIGKAAARLVIERIEGTGRAKRRIERLPVEFVPRQSTGPARITL